MHCTHSLEENWILPPVRADGHWQKDKWNEQNLKSSLPFCIHPSLKPLLDSSQLSSVACLNSWCTPRLSGTHFGVGYAFPRMGALQRQSQHTCFERCAPTFQLYRSQSFLTKLWGTTCDAKWQKHDPFFHRNKTQSLKLQDKHLPKNWSSRCINAFAFQKPILP